MEKSKAGRKTISQRAARRLTSGLLSIALFIALSVIASPRVTAQVECLGACEAQLASCKSSENCQDAYEACVDACLGQYARILD
jgi:hypothetical protein